jgi:hypothetical protein
MDLSFVFSFSAPVASPEIDLWHVQDRVRELAFHVDISGSCSHDLSFQLVDLLAPIYASAWILF